MEPLVIEKKLERLKDICTALEQENDIKLKENQKYILDSFKNPRNILTEDKEESNPSISSLFGSFRVNSQRRSGISYLAYHLARVSSKNYITCLIYPSLGQLRFCRRSLEGDDLFYFPNNINWMSVSDFENSNRTDCQVCIFDLGERTEDIKRVIKDKDLIYPNSMFLIFSSGHK